MPTLKPDFNRINPIVVGAKRIAFALVKTNTNDTLEFEEVEEFSRLRKYSIAPQYADNELDSNDAVEDEGNEITGYEVTVDVTGIKPETEAKIYGHTIDANGGMVEKEGDTPPKLALLIESPLSKSAGSKYIALYCGAAKQPTEEGESKTRNSFSRSLPTITFSFGRALNGLLKYSLSSASASYNSKIGKAWFDAVQLPATVVASDSGSGSGS